MRASLLMMLVALSPLGGCKRAELETARAQASQLEQGTKKLQSQIAQLQKENAELKKSAAEVAARSLAMKSAAEHALELAQQAYAHRDFKSAATIARAYVDAQPEKAWQLVGACACSQRDAVGAREAIDRLATEGRAIVTETCARAGLKL